MVKAKQGMQTLQQRHRTATISLHSEALMLGGQGRAVAYPQRAKALTQWALNLREVLPELDPQPSGTQSQILGRSRNLTISGQSAEKRIHIRRPSSTGWRIPWSV